MTSSTARWHRGAVLQTHLTDRGLKFEPGADKLQQVIALKLGAQMILLMVCLAETPLAEHTSASGLFKKSHPHFF